MAFSTTSTAVTRSDLAALVQSVDLMSERNGFIGTKVLRVLDVAAQADQFARVMPGDLLNIPDTNRNSDGSYKRGEMKFEDDFYSTRDRGFEEKVDERDKKIYGTWFDAEALATERAAWVVMASQEKRVAEFMYNTDVYTGASLTTAIVNEWDDYAAAEPIDDVNAAAEKVWQATGVWPNAITLNELQFKALKRCNQILEALQALGAGVQALQGNVTEAMIAEALNLKYVLVAKGTKNAANPGQQFSAGQIWSSEYASVCRIAETDNIKEPCVGRTFHWTGDGSVAEGLVETYREENKRGDFVRVRHEVQEKGIIIQAAHLLSNVMTL